MQSHVAFHNVDHSRALEFFIQQRSSRLNKLLWRGEKISWVIEQDSKEFKPVLNLKLRNKQFKVSAKQSNAFSAVNEVIDKAKRVVNKFHAKLRHSH